MESNGQMVECSNGQWSNSQWSMVKRSNGTKWVRNILIKILKNIILQKGPPKLMIIERGLLRCGRTNMITKAPTLIGPRGWRQFDLIFTLLWQLNRTLYVIDIPLHPEEETVLSPVAFNNKSVQNALDLGPRFAGISSLRKGGIARKLLTDDAAVMQCCKISGKYVKAS